MYIGATNHLLLDVQYGSVLQRHIGSVSRTDHVCHVSSDEFAALFPNATQELLQQFCKIFPFYANFSRSGQPGVWVEDNCKKAPM